MITLPSLSQLTRLTAISSTNNSVTSLELGHNRIQNDGAQILGLALQDYNCRVQVLDLSFNLITLNGVQHLADALRVAFFFSSFVHVSTFVLLLLSMWYVYPLTLQKNETLHTLELGGNRISDQALTSFTDADPNVFFEELVLTRMAES